MRLRSPITMVVLVLIVVVGGIVGWRLATQAVPSLHTKPSSSCAFKRLAKGSKLHAHRITVNVYNAGSVSGAANVTMEKLTQHGFTAGSIDNAGRVKVHNVAIVTKEPKSAAVRLLTEQFRGRVGVRKKARGIPATFSVVIGNHFAGVTRHAPRIVRVQHSQKLCIPRSTS